jgi:tetratricopeptide (TPR) repeat protein
MKPTSNQNDLKNLNPENSLNDYSIHDSNTAIRQNVAAMASSRSFDIFPDEINQTEKHKQTQKASSKFNKNKLFTFFTAISIIAVIFGWIHLSKERAKQQILKSEKLKIAVFPFTNQDSNAETDNLSQVLANNLIERLAKYSNLETVLNEEIQQYQKTKSDPSKLAKDAGVEKIITGSYSVKDGLVTVNVDFKSELSDLAPITKTFTKPLKNVTDGNREIIQFLELTFEFTKADSIINAKEMELNNPKAYDSYIHAMSAIAINDLDNGIGYLRELTKQFPRFTPVWEALFTAYYRKGISGCGVVCYDEAIRAVENAAKIEPDNLRIKNALSAVLTERNRVEEAVEMTQKVLANNPNSREALNSLSYSYRYAGMLEESLQMTFRSIEGDNSASNTNMAVNSLLYMGKYDEFRTLLNKPTTRIYPRFFLGFLEFHEKNYDKAKEDFLVINQIESSHLLSRLGMVYISYIDKKPEEGLVILNNIKSDIYQREVYDGEMIYKIAQAFSVLNDRKSALELFQLSVEKGFFCYPYFVNDPLMENIRKEPNFNVTLKIAKQRHDSFKARFFN